MLWYSRLCGLMAMTNDNQTEGYVFDSLSDSILHFENISCIKVFVMVILLPLYNLCSFARIKTVKRLAHHFYIKRKSNFIFYEIQQCH